MLKIILAIGAIFASSSAFAECASGYTQIAVPLCQQSNNLAPGFYVSASGSDSNSGTLASPFATLTKAQSAMQVSGAPKLTYVRGGSYAPAAIPNCNGDTVSCGLALTASDNGEVFQYYPPDGYNSADITGGSISDGNGLFYMFDVSNASNITFNGLKLHNFQYAAVHSGGNAGAMLLENSEVYNNMATTGHTSPGSIACYGCSNWTITHNYIHDSGNWGVNVAGANGTVTNLTVTYNYFSDICTGRQDCAAIYLVDTPQTSTGTVWNYNYIHNGNTGAPLGSGYGSAMYADDCAGSVTAIGDIITGRNGSNTAMLFHGGRNIHVNNNLIDLSTLQQSAVAFQTSSCPNNTMSGNQVEHNIIISGGSGNSGGFNILSGSPPTSPVITANAYHAYGSGSISNGGNYTDSNPVPEDPQLSCWTYNIASGSPVFNAPVSFPALPTGWGPPGFTIPQTGIAPSSPHGC